VQSKKQFETIDEYIKTLPKDVQNIPEKMSRPLERRHPIPRKRSVSRFLISN
jgi:hypothetical protein